METYFTSDTHFGHANIIKYSNRPFGSVQEMDEALITFWNERVKPGDLVYHLGDVSFHHVNSPALPTILRRLNGNIAIVPGNHDSLRHLTHMQSAVKPRLTVLPDLYETRVEGQRMTLCHYAMRVWNKSHYGAWQLYGHSHGSLPDDPNALSMDVGVDAGFGYAPIHFSTVAEHMSQKTFKPVDHHR